MVRKYEQQLETMPDRVLTLLSEIAVCSSRLESGESEEAKLMRLSTDPFLLRGHVRDRASDGDKEMLGPHKTPHALESWISQRTEEAVSTRNAMSKNGQYHPAEPQMVNSLQPEIFAATDEDIAQALEIYPLSRPGSLHKRVRDEVYVSVMVIRGSVLFFLAVLAMVALAELLPG